MSQERDFEPTLVTDHADRMTYSGYLRLDRLLTSQDPLTSPPHHDELLFIIQHQTTELWLKLVVHELSAATRALAEDNAEPCFKVLARVKRIQEVLYDQWGVLETLTPSEYTQFRGVLGSSSGFQSVQYRIVEFMLGNKDARMIDFHKHDPEASGRLAQALNQPSIYDEFLRFMARRGLPVPSDVVQRDVTKPHEPSEGVVEALRLVYSDTSKWWDAYEMAEKLIDIEESFSLWRFRHMKVVARVIGYKTGTGGSSGVPFLEKMVSHTFFPELWRVRTAL